MLVIKPAGLLCLLLFPLGLLGQITVSGIVREVGSGEPISYARVTLEDRQQGRLSNERGFFSLSVPRGLVELSVQRSGYQPMTQSWTAVRDTFLELALIPAAGTLDTVQISATEGLRDLQLGRTLVPMAQIEAMPALGGEGDALKALQLLPGVQFGQEGTAGLFIRGGSPDQNLILLDEMPVYNVSHLFGFFSLFPPDVIQDLEVYKGAFPARYGGRLSSVIRLQTKEGSLERWQGQASLSPLSGQVQVEGPLLPGKSSVFLAARRSWLDLLLRPFTGVTFRQSEARGSLGYTFHDLIGKANYQFSPRSRLFLSVYTGRDRGSLRVRPDDSNSDSLRTQTDGQLAWGNITTSLRHQQVLGQRWFVKTVLGYTRYRYQQELGITQSRPPDDQVLFELRSGNYSWVRDWIAKQEWEGQLGQGHTLRLGGQASLKRFEPDVRYLSREDGQVQTDSSFQNATLRSELGSLYASYRYAGTRLSAYAGLRGEGFRTQGRYWWSLQPRVQAAWHLSDRWKLEAGYSLVQQYLHLLTNSGLGLPTDLWVPATVEVPPARSHQVSAGLFHQLGPHTSVALEGYWKDLKGVIAYRDGTSYLNDFANWQDRVEAGQGRAYGLELFVHRRAGRFQGWVSYTLSRATRQFAQINQGAPFPFRYDRRHNVSLLASYTLPNPNRSLSLTWMYVSGARATLPTEQYHTAFDLYENLYGITDNLLGSEETYIFGHSAVWADGRNNYQLPAFHKLDLAYRTRKAKKWGTRTWEFGIYNAYGRRNPYYVTYGTDFRFTPGIGSRNVPVIRAYSFLLWVPYVSYQAAF